MKVYAKSRQKKNKVVSDFIMFKNVSKSRASYKPSVIYKPYNLFLFLDRITSLAIRLDTYATQISSYHITINILKK